jgi:predicted DNA-binding transcriptional regulator AlpA
VSEVKSKPRAKPPLTERLAYNIGEFCDFVGISRSYFYTLPEADRPRMTRRGSRWLISADAAREWVQRDSVVA